MEEVKSVDMLNSGFAWDLLCCGSDLPDPRCGGSVRKLFVILSSDPCRRPETRQKSPLEKTRRLKLRLS